jgi:hypothetical protein
MCGHDETYQKDLILRFWLLLKDLLMQLSHGLSLHRYTAVKSLHRTGKPKELACVDFLNKRYLLRRPKACLEVGSALTIEPPSALTSAVISISKASSMVLLSFCVRKLYCFVKRQ